MVVDPYADGTILTMIAKTSSEQLQLKILGRRFPADFTTECSKFREQHEGMSLDCRVSADFHDRFIILDELECFFVGASIKDAGKKAFFVAKFEDEQNREALKKQFEVSWASASPWP